LNRAVSKPNSEKRMATEFSQGVPAPTYDEFVKPVMASFASRIRGRILTAEDVAKAIFGAATDGSEAAALLIGDDIAPLIQAKSQKTEREYLSLVRDRYVPKK